MFGALADAIEGLEIPQERDALAAVLALRDRLDAKVTSAVGAYAAAGLHEVDGSVTMSSWLRHHAGVDPTRAVVDARRAAKLQQLPVLRVALETGVLSAGAVEVILAKIPKRHIDLFASHEGELVPALVELDVDAVATAMSTWRARADALDPGPEPADRPDTVHLSVTLEDRGVLNGSLGSDLHNLLATALRVADPKDFDLPLAQRHAAALGQVCQTFLDAQTTFRGGRHRPHLTVTVSAERLAGLDDAPPATYTDTGMPVTDIAVAVHRCDSMRNVFVHDRGAILSYGRAVRDWPVDIANAIAARDLQCRWPGCTAPVHWCDIHHVVPWEDGGTTDIDNGSLLCRRHHRLLHDRRAGFSFKLLPDGTAVLTHPDGRTEHSDPKGLDPPRLPIPDG